MNTATINLLKSAHDDFLHLTLHATDAGTFVNGITKLRQAIDELETIKPEQEAQNGTDE